MGTSGKPLAAIGTAAISGPISGGNTTEGGRGSALVGMVSKGGFLIVVSGFSKGGFPVSVVVSGFSNGGFPVSVVVVVGGVWATISGLGGLFFFLEVQFIIGKAIVAARINFRMFYSVLFIFESGVDSLDRRSWVNTQKLLPT